MGFLATPTRNVNYSCSSPVRVSATGAAREDRPQPGTVGASRMPGGTPLWTLEDRLGKGEGSAPISPRQVAYSRPSYLNETWSFVR